MAKTRVQLRTHTRMYLDEVSEADWEDDQINTELNYAKNEVYTAVVETWEDYYRDKVVTDFVANQSEYQLPDNFFKVRRLEVTYASGENGTKALPMSFDLIRESLDSTSQGSSSRPVYDLSGRFLQVLPYPTTTVTNGLRMYYIRTSDEMDEDDDVLDIPFPDRYGRLVVLAAAAELLRKGQQEEAASAKYKVDFELGLEKMKQELEERMADGTKRIEDVMGGQMDFGTSITYDILNLR